MLPMETRREKMSFKLFPQKAEIELILKNLKIYEQFIYGDMRYVSNSFYKTLLKLAKLYLTL